MLQGFVTKKGTGIQLFGDYSDLGLLYETIHQLANVLDEHHERTAGQHQLLMNFAYEVRHTRQGNRLKEKFKLEDDEITYFGAQFTWVDILIFTSLLRSRAGYCMLDKLQQSSLYLLEHVIERTLRKYVPVHAENLVSVINGAIPFDHPYTFLIYQKTHSEFLLLPLGNKARMKTLYNLLWENYHPFSKPHVDFVKQLEKTAKENACKVIELEQTEFPEIVW
tara:strand:+ start:551 stop:1216 length:666 start_codon:yes stop_codon:yes gene_type:complete